MKELLLSPKPKLWEIPLVLIGTFILTDILFGNNILNLIKGIT